MDLLGFEAHFMSDRTRGLACNVYHQKARGSGQRVQAELVPSASRVCSAVKATLTRQWACTRDMFRIRNLPVTGSTRRRRRGCRRGAPPRRYRRSWLEPRGVREATSSTSSTRASERSERSCR